VKVGGGGVGRGVQEMGICCDSVGMRDRGAGAKDPRGRRKVVTEIIHLTVT
jgi:hypothetical protein